MTSVDLRVRLLEPGYNRRRELAALREAAQDARINVQEFHNALPNQRLKTWILSSRP